MSIISLFIEDSVIGISYYDESEDTICCSQLTIIPKNREDILQLLLDFEDVDVLLVPSNINLELLQYMKESYFDEKGKALFIQRIMSAEYTYDNSINKLLDLNYKMPFLSINQQQTTDVNGGLDYENSEITCEQEQQKYDILMQIIDLDKQCMIKSLGGLLCSLINNQRISRQFSVQNIKFEKNLYSRVNFNQQTLNYLSIFKDEIHPSMIKGKGRTKEGFSLFMLFSKFIYTKLGLKKLKHLFLTPSFDIKLLQKRNESIEYFYSAPPEKIKNIKQFLGKCVNVNQIINKLRDVQMKFDDWYRLKINLESSLKLMFIFLGLVQSSNFQDQTDSFLFLKHLSQASFDKLSELNAFLDSYLEFSLSEGEITIRPGIVKELDELLKVFENLDEILDYYSCQEFARLKEQSQGFKSQMLIQYFPQLGFFVTIEKEIDHNNQQVIMASGNKLNSSQEHSPGFKVDKKYLLDQKNKIQIQIKLGQAQQQDNEEEYENERNKTSNFNNKRDLFLKQANQGQSDSINYQLSQLQQSIPNQSLINDNFHDQNNEENNIMFGKHSQSQSQQNNQVEGEEDHFSQKYESNQLISQYGLLDDYQFCFSLQDALLFKNDLCVHLDDKYGDIQSRIIDIQRDVLREIEYQILLCCEQLIEVSSFVGDLDLYFCLYQAAEALNLRKPQLSESSILLLYEMRNILTEISVGEKSYIANSFSVYNFSNDTTDQSITSQTILNKNCSNRFTFITGPNYSGKSVLLKTVANLLYNKIHFLLFFNQFLFLFQKYLFFIMKQQQQILKSKIGMVCYLAHIGSFIPCRFAKIGMMDGIYSTSSQHDSVLKFTGETAKQLSTLNHILHQATNQSLIIIDELGKNLRLSESLKINYSLIKCLTEDNFSLQPCVNSEKNNLPVIPSSLDMEDEIKCQDKDSTYQLDHFKQQYNKIPITLMASHLNQLFNFPDFKENYLLRFAHMEVLIEDGKNVYKVSEIKKDLSNQQKIVHVYRLKKGATRQSCAVLVAKSIIGKNESLISRAFEINHLVQNGILKLNPREILEVNHLEKVKKVIEYLTC